MLLAFKDKNTTIKWIGAGAAFLVSFLGYWRTVAPTTSFWDCGEFIACSYILGVVHPPGSPLYLLMGRIASLIPIVKDIGLRVNMLSVLVSAFSVFFTFLVIEQLIRRWRGIPKNWEDRLIVYGSSFIGAVAFAFTTSQWFNAVEAEVYAFSTFFTVLVVWLALYWGENAHKKGNMLIIFFIFYMFGLATGVHLLNILAFPLVFLIVYFSDNVQVKRMMVLIFVQAALPLLLYVILFQYDSSRFSYQQMIAHQEKADGFLKTFGLIWVAVTLAYMYFKDRTVFKAWWILPLLFIIAYSTYLMIYIRAGLAPPINQNDPSTLEALSDYLARKQYGEEEMMLTFLKRKADFWHYQINMMYTRYFGWQFIGKGVAMDAHDRIIQIISFRGLWGLPFLLGLFGAVHQFSKDWKYGMIVLVLFIMTGYAIIIYLNQNDPQPRERDYSYVGSFFAFALWIGTGAAGILETIAESLKNKEKLKKSLLTAVSILIFLAVPLNMFAFNFHSHDRTGNYLAWDYSYNILQTCEENGIIFTNGDNDTFPLWFLQEVYGIRKDVQVANLSLINTSWYIRQLKDRDTQVAYRMTDETIKSFDENGPYVATISILFEFADREDLAKEIQRLKEEKALPPQFPETFRTRSNVNYLNTFLTQNFFPIHRLNWDNFKLNIPVGDNVIQKHFKPTFHDYFRVQDYMVLKTIADVGGERPVYFAVTVANEHKLGLDNYLRMDGLAFKIMPNALSRDESIRPDILRKNLFEIYQYRNLDNPYVYYNTNKLKLMQNYRSAFQQLSAYYLEKEDTNSARETLNMMEEKIPESVIPFSSEFGAILIAQLYDRIGEDPEIDRRVANVIEGHYVPENQRMSIAEYYAQVYQDYERAVETIRPLLEQNPSNSQVFAQIIRYLVFAKLYDEAVEEAELWKIRNPGDRMGDMYIEQIRMIASQDTVNQEEYSETN